MVVLVLFVRSEGRESVENQEARRRRRRSSRGSGSKKVFYCHSCGVIQFR